MAIFAGSVLILLGLVYWTTAGFMARQTDDTIQAEITGLEEQYRQRGLSTGNADSAAWQRSSRIAPGRTRADRRSTCSRIRTIDLLPVTWTNGHR
jgi:hypothetical protein